MTILFARNRDQALLALMLQEARRAADEANMYVGRTAVQKLMYFAKQMGTPMDYQFDIYHYGPFCQEIMQDIDLLTFDGVIKDKASKPEYSNYYPSDNMEEILSLHEQELNHYREKIRDVVKLISLKPDQLEMLSTLDFIYRKEKASVASGSIKERVLDQFFKYKENKFKKDDMLKYYDLMVEAKIFEE